MSQAYLPAVRRRLLADTDSPYAPMNDESVLNAPPVSGGPYSPPPTSGDDARSRAGGASGPYGPPTPGAPSPNSPADYSSLVRDVYLPEQGRAFQNLESAYSAPHAGTLRQVLGAFLGNRNPALGGIVSGETGRNHKIEAAEREYGLIANAIAANRAMQTADISNYKNAAEGRKFSAEAEGAPAKAALEQAQAEAANYKEDPNLGLIDLRTKQPVNANALAPLTADEAQVLGKQEGERVPLKLKNTANEIVNRGYTTVNTEEGVYERKRGAGATDMTRLGANPRMMFAPGERYVPVAADPNNPGALTYRKAGEASKLGLQAPQSAEVQAAKGTLKSATSGKIGDEINAFNTALQHADLLKSAVVALGNGDENTLNAIKNRFSNEFGSTGPLTAQVIADAYTREVNKMLSSGHMTDSEIGTIGKTLNVNRQSAHQSIAALDAYKALALSKMKMRQEQVKQGMQGKPNFPTTQNSDPLGIRP